MPAKKDVVKKTEAAKRKMKKKPPAKKSKPKPKTKQKQTQTQNVIINLSDVRKRTRRKMTSSGGKRPLPLSAFSGSAQAPIYVNPHGSAYRDLIRPLKEHQREMRASAQDDLMRTQALCLRAIKWGSSSMFGSRARTGSGQEKLQRSTRTGRTWYSTTASRRPSRARTLSRSP